jgi:hypothetical protein
MKIPSSIHIAFLSITLFLFALCDSPTSTSSTDTTDNAPFHPPSWLIGTWKPVKTSFVEPLKITSKNIYRISGTQEIEGFKDFVNEAESVINGQSTYTIATSDHNESYTFLYNSTASMTLKYTISGQTVIADFKKQ